MANFQAVLRRGECPFAGADHGASPKHSLACWGHKQLFSPRFLHILELRSR